MMSAIGPEFLNFIKKLEDNGDKILSSTPLEQPLDFEFNVWVFLNEILNQSNGIKD